MLAKVSDLFKMEDDMLYIAGERKGEKKGMEKGALVTKLLLQTDYSVERIAETAEVSVDFVNQVKATL